MRIAILFVGSQLGLQLWRHVCGDDGRVAFVGEVQDVTDAVHLRKQGGFGIGNSKLDPHAPGTEPHFEFLKERVHTLSGARGNSDAARMVAELALDYLPIRYSVDLVENDDRLFPIGAEFGNRLLYREHLIPILGMADIDDVNEKIRELNLLQGGLERLDHRMGKFADETDRVSQQDLLPIRQNKLVGWSGRVSRKADLRRRLRLR